MTMQEHSGSPRCLVGARGMRFVRATALVMVVCAGSLMAVQAQPPAGDGGKPPVDDRAPVSGDRLRDRLDKALKESERQQEQLRAAIAKLEKGEDPETVRRGLDMPILRFLMGREAGPGNRPGGDGMGGPDDRGEGFRGQREGEGPGQGEFAPGGPGRGGPDQAPRPMGPDRFARPGDGPRGDGAAPGPRGGPDGPRQGMRPGGPMGGPDGPGRPGAGGEDDRERLKALIERELPEFAQRAKELREKHPQLADRMLARVAPRLREAMQVKDRDPELFKLRIEEVKGGLDVLESIHALRQLDRDTSEGAKAKRAEALGKVRDALSKSFDQRLKLQEHDAAQLGERVSKLREEIEKKRADRDKVLGDMVDRIDRGEMLPPQ